MNRRDFLAQASTAAFTIALPTALRAALDKDNVYRKNIGVQLYTVRKLMEKDTVGTIKAVAAAGYKQAELGGFPSQTDAQLKAARDAGLVVNSSHFEWDSLVNPTDSSYQDFRKIVDKAHAAGLKHLVVPYLVDKNRTTLDDYKQTAAHLNKGAELSKAAGIRLSYHNHAFEFQPLAGGRTGFDVFMSEFSPDMFFELDVFWVKVGGSEPTDLLKQLSGRVAQVHLKDLKPGLTLPEFGKVPEDAFQELGDGILSWEPILKAAQAAGVEHCHVEQDQSPDPLASIRQSINYLARL
jgi:sugar phosphate isomerase/epimerase